MGLRACARSMLGCIFLALLAGGCSAASQSNPSSSSVPSASTAQVVHGEVMVALEPGPRAQPIHNRISLRRPDGSVIVSHSFTPRSAPRVNFAAPVLAPEATVVDGHAYYADGEGRVRALAVDGTEQQVAQFPLTGSQQSLSFAVSPDGSRLVGAVFTWPEPSPSPGQAFGPGNFALDIYAASPGQAATRIRHQEWPQTKPPTDAVAVVGWALDAPVVTTDMPPATQQASPGLWFWGHVSTLGPDGWPQRQLGGSGCRAVAVNPDGTLLCVSESASAQARNPDGSLLFEAKKPGDGGFTLSPDGQRVTAGTQVAGRDGSVVQLPSTFVGQGWLDRQTVVGVQATPQGESNVDELKLASPSQVKDLGFQGLFVGALNVP
ncbi:MAG: hypothetical protein DLM66_00800 [Candidatus Dormiibacter spiritus]|nr:MAG: hypothetical protein DLM66_00800 [Candidatus Dormibacteraeota bacterium]